MMYQWFLEGPCVLQSPHDEQRIAVQEAHDVSPQWVDAQQWGAKQGFYWQESFIFSEQDKPFLEQYLKPLEQAAVIREQIKIMRDQYVITDSGSLNMGYVIKARDRIEPGTWLGAYVGEVTTHAPAFVPPDEHGDQGDYVRTMGDSVFVNAYPYRNHTGFFSHAMTREGLDAAYVFSNIDVDAIQTANVADRCMDRVMLASAASLIQPGEILCWPYGALAQMSYWAARDKAPVLWYRDGTPVDPSAYQIRLPHRIFVPMGLDPCFDLPCMFQVAWDDLKTPFVWRRCTPETQEPLVEFVFAANSLWQQLKTKEVLQDGRSMAGCRVKPDELLFFPALPYHSVEKCLFKKILNKHVMSLNRLGEGPYIYEVYFKTKRIAECAVSMLAFYLDDIIGREKSYRDVFHIFPDTTSEGMIRLMIDLKPLGVKLGSFKHPSMLLCHFLTLLQNIPAI